METGHIVGVCRVAATALSGMFAGGALYINVVQIPALRTVKDTPSFRQCWKESFLIASKYQPGLAVGAIVASGVGYYLDESDQRYLLLAGAATLAGIFPLTKFVMMADIQKLLKDDVVSERGEAWVRKTVDNWNTRHFVRSMLGMASFGIYLYLNYSKN